MIQPITSTNCNTPVPTIRQDDERQHIQDTRLFTVWRGMRSYRLAWNEMTAQERAWETEAQLRDEYCAINRIYC